MVPLPSGLQGSVDVLTLPHLPVEHAHELADRRRPSVPRLHRGDHAFLLQNLDGRIVFAIPFEDRFTLVGTTDVEWTGEPNSPRISDEEADYLLTTVARSQAGAWDAFAGALFAPVAADPGAIEAWWRNVRSGLAGAGRTGHHPHSATHGRNS